MNLEIAAHVAGSRLCRLCRNLGDALGLLGGYDNAVNALILDKHQKTIIYGLGFTTVLYLLWEIVA